MHSGSSGPVPAPPATGGFRALWCGIGLGDHRPCRGTYDGYLYESLPPLDPARFTGAFDWLGPAGDPVPGQVAEVEAVAEVLKEKGLALPADFTAFTTSEGLYRALDRISATACWSDLSAPLPSPVEDGAFLVRFLRDQQDCVIWYLYLRPSSETFVVHSTYDFEYGYAADEPTVDAAGADGVGEPAEPIGAAGEAGEPAEPDAGWRWDEIFWCAPTFEEFAYRFWTENTLWYAVGRTNRSKPAPAQQTYLDHYAPAVPTP